MSSFPAAAPKPKKSVALSGVPAGNTALCTVGRTGNDLHYRGYDILDFAEQAEFEEVAYLLVHEKLPTRDELKKYKSSLKRMRGLPKALKAALERVPKKAHPMDVLRTGVSVLGTIEPEKDDHGKAGAQRIADRLMASMGSMLLYWYHYSHHGKRIDTETDDDSIGGHFLRLLHGKKPSEAAVRAMHTSLILYAEHEFNASTFACRVVAGTGSDMYSAICGGIGALRGPKHGGANEFAFEVLSRYKNPDRRRSRHRPPRAGEGDRDRLRPPGVHDRRSAQPGDQGGRQAPFAAGEEHEAVRHRRAARARDAAREEHVRQPRLVQRGVLPPAGRAHRDVHAGVRDLAHQRLVGARHRAARRRQDHPPGGQLHRAREQQWIPLDKR